MHEARGFLQIFGRMFFLGLAAALVASALFNLGVALQGIEARAAPRTLSLRVSLLGRLLGRPRWLLGLALGFVGIAPQVLALATAPFVVVQTALAAGLLLILWLGVRWFGESVGRNEVAAVAAIIGGVALVAWGAPAHVEAHRGGLAPVLVVGGLGVVALLPFAVRSTRFDVAMLSIVASGCGFGASNIATKLLSDDVAAREWANAAGWAAGGLALGVAATITGMSAFQRARATTVVPVSTSVQIFLPMLLEPVFLREHWATLTNAWPVALGIVLALAGSLVLTRSPAVAELAASASR